ncbi:N-acetylmuramoyl-L-alanine amidase [Halobacillus fulvus]|nr:N-acetylmuramoyl-L-alanine amidase [Halobacillus fulvus]
MFRTSKKLIVAGLMLLLAFFLPMHSASASSLSDVPDRSSDEINYLIGKGIIQGYPGGTFKPFVSVSRQEAATMVGRALKLNGTKRTTVFPDVDRNSYASGYIQSAYEKGIITGYPSGTYKPQNNITRGEMAYLVSKAFNLTETSGNQFSDVPDSGSLSQAIDKVSTARIAQGYPSGTYKPNRTITREEFSVMMARALNPEYKVDGETSSGKEYIVSTGVLNVRSGPSTSYSLIGKLYEGAVVKVSSISGSWGKITYNGQTAYIHTDYIKEKGITSDTPLIAIDAGHGDHDGGAAANGLTEKEVNLDVAKRVQGYLKNNTNIGVVMTRTDDSFLELDERVDFAVQNGADTFVSIHANASIYDSANGTETFYSSAALSDRAYKSKKLAEFIQARLVVALNTRDRGVKEAPFRVINATPLPSALVELGFLTNDSDASKLGSSYYRDRAAKAIYLGIQDYYNWK